MMDRFLRNNLFLRILAIVLACILWLGVHAPQDNTSSSQSQSTGVTQAYHLPIHVEVGDDMVVSSMSQSTSTINVTTSILNLASLPAEMLKVQLVANAQGLGSGTQVLHIAAVDMPNDIKHYTLQPSTVTVALEKKVTQAKPIDIEINGTPANGYAMGQLVLNAQSVSVSGAKALVQSVSRVVGTVDVSGMKSTDTKIVDLTPVDSHGSTVQDVDISPTSISVNVPIQSSDQKVSLSPEVMGTPAPGYAVSGVQLDNDQASETGVPSSSLPKTGLVVPIDVSGLSKTSTLDVPIPLMQGMTQITPSSVAATVTIEPSSTVTFNQVPVRVQNATSGVKVTLPDNPTLDVTVTGPKSIVNGMTAADVDAFVDASKLKSGATSATVAVKVPQWVSVSNLSQRSVNVQIAQNG